MKNAVIFDSLYGSLNDHTRINIRHYNGGARSSDRFKIDSAINSLIS